MTTWTTRQLPAGRVAAGDVLVDKATRLWAVTSATASLDDDGEADGEVVLTATRAEDDKTLTFAVDRPVSVLLAEDDQRALELVAGELGGVETSRSVA